MIESKEDKPTGQEEKKMTTGYQIYMKNDGENTFTPAGLNNWFWKEEDAIARKKELDHTWNKYGIEYIIVKLG